MSESSNTDMLSSCRYTEVSGYSNIECGEKGYA